MENDFVRFAAASGATGLLISLTLQSMKKSKIVRWLSVESGRLNFLASSLMSLLAAVAINYSFNMQSIMDGGVFQLTINGSLAGIAHGVMRWGWQMLNTHGMYKLFIVPAETQGEIRCLLKQLIETNQMFQAAMMGQGAKMEVHRTGAYKESPRR